MPRSPGNQREGLDACICGKTKPGANFEFSGLVTETLLLGNVALHVAERLIWDRANLKALRAQRWTNTFAQTVARAGLCSPDSQLFFLLIVRLLSGPGDQNGQRREISGQAEELIR